MRGLLAGVVMLVVALLVVGVASRFLEGRAVRDAVVPVSFSPHELPQFRNSSRPPAASGKSVPPGRAPAEGQDSFRG
jgi:hypothetical protein